MRQKLPMQFLRYLGLLFNRAAQKSVLLTDRLTVLIVPFATLVLWLAGVKTTDSVQETLFLSIAIAVLAVAVLRLVAASYFLWRDDQAEKARLHQDLAAPDREAQATMQRHTLDLRMRLSDRLGRLAAYASYPPAVLEQDASFKANYNDLVSEIDTLVNQLSYDFPLRIAAIRLRDYCLRLIRDKKEPEDHFWDQRRITFRIIHKNDTIADFMSLIELEILLEDAGVAVKQSSDIVEEMKDYIRKLGPRYHEKELQDSIREAIARNTPISLI